MKEIVQEGAPVLRAVAEPLPEGLFGTPELTTLISDMSEALDREPEGVALAAPQVGVSWRLFIVRMDRTRPVSAPTSDDGGVEVPVSGEGVPAPSEVEVFINPDITKTSRKRTEAEEGCLSVRGVYGTTMPHERVTLRARRADGTVVERGAGGLLAQIFEHEVNHLNGILFIDHAEHLITLPHAPEE